MHSTTDTVIAICLIFLFYRGWANGFLRNIFGPASLILSCLLAAVYFRETKNMITALLIGILGPFALNILFSVLIAVWNKTMDGKKDPSQISRLLGAGVSLLWGGLHLVVILALISLAPENPGWMKNMKSDVLQSRGYTMVVLWIKNLAFEAFPDIGKAARILRDPGYSQKLRSLPEYAELMRDQTIRYLLSDEELMKKLQNRDIKEMVTNPKTRAVFQNPALLKKLMDMNIKIIEQTMEKNSGEAVKPKWMEIE